VALGILVALIVGATIEITRLGAGDEGDEQREGSVQAVAGPTATTAPPPTTRPPFNYQVQRGETLTVLSRRFGVTVDAIVEANHLPNENQVAEGQLLLVPPPTPVALVVTPATTARGRSVQLKLIGAQASERVTFQIDSPTGSFVGPPHTAPQEGTVTTTYSVAPDAPEGMFTVTAKGDRGTTVQATFRVLVAAPVTSPSPP
jgi:LysM repeat protein